MSVEPTDPTDPTVASDDTASTDPVPTDVFGTDLPDRDGPPNILLVILDDVGTDGVGAYGEHPDAPPTPTIDSLADEGLLFRNVWSGSPPARPPEPP